MKKNLLTIMFVFSFLCLGLFVSDANASTSTKNIFRREQNKNNDASKPKSINISKTEFNKKYAELKELCKSKRFMSCEAGLAVASAASAIAW